MPMPRETSEPLEEDVPEGVPSGAPGRKKRRDRNERTISDALLDQLLAQVEEPKDLLGPDGLMRQLMGRLVERTLDAELTEHLGYERNAPRPGSNARNGSTRKTLLTEAGKVDVEIPRDRDGTFEPQVIPKHQRRFDGFDERILALYGRGMTVREIQGFFKDAYDADISPSLISRVTDAALEDVEIWRNRRLDELYPIVYLDGLVVKVRTDARVEKRTVYVALGVNLEGHKELLGLWMAGAEGAKFWLHVMTELKNRGVNDILIACCDGLKGFPQAIEAIFPETVVQTCIVHLIRNSLRLVAWGNRKAVARSLKPVYGAATAQQAKDALVAFDEEWGTQYPSIAKTWRDHWEQIEPFFAFPNDIRRAIYTTNIIEALNAQLRKALKPKGHFPSEDAAMKVLFLALQHAQKKWTRPIQRWDLALQQLAIYFEGRLAL